MDQVESILAEALAEDLPVGEHMLLWSEADVKRYAEEGGFWSPPMDADTSLSRAATHLALNEPSVPYSWETYEQHAIPLDSPGGAALAAAMSDGWAVRCAHIMSGYEPQAEGSWCGIASLVIVLRTLQLAGEVPSQYGIFKGFVQGGGKVVPGGSMRHGLSMAQEQQLCALALGKLGARFRVVREPAADAGLANRLGQQLRAAESSDAHFLVNLLRYLPSEHKGGRGVAHWSPLAGYVEREAESYALFLDVAAPRIGAHWVPLRLLGACMATRNMHNEPRGYLRLEPEPGPGCSTDPPTR